MKGWTGTAANALERNTCSGGSLLLSTALAAALALPLVMAAPQDAWPQEAALDPKQPESQEIPGSFAELAERLSPAVVNVTTTTNVAQVDQGEQPIIPEGSPFEDFFRDFMDRPPGEPGAPMPQRRSNALGSGFVISADGYIVTNNHVIEAADEISVELFSGEEIDAEVIGRDPRTDIALLKVKSATICRSSSSAIPTSRGSATGWSRSATRSARASRSRPGIVSARNRMLQGSYDDFIQTDAAINRGNSGGPLFNMDGEVIGVNTAILSPNGGSIGIGFAMSSAVVEQVVDQLREFGETRRGWLGVRIQNVDPDMAEALGLEAAEGALITDVPEGPAQVAGLEAGDVILEFNGEKIEDTRELVRVVADTPVGDAVEVLVFRDGAEQRKTVEIGRLEEEPTLASAPGQPDAPGGAPSRPCSA